MSNKEIGMKNKFIPVIGISIAISIFNTIPVTARTNIGTNSNRRYSDTEHILSVNTLVVFTKIPTQRQLPDSRLVSQIAQTSGSPENTDQKTIELNRKSISDLEQLDPDANPLLFPTQPSEVEIDTLQSITIEQAIELALKNNKDIVEARIEIEQSRFALREERAALFPTLDFGSAFMSPSVLGFEDSGFLDSVAEQEADAGLPVTRSPSTGAASFDFNPNLGLRYDIYDGGLRGALIRTAEKQLRIAELDLETVIEDVRLETLSDYYTLQDNDAQVEIEEAAVEEATRTFRDAQLLEEAGVGTRFDVLRARVELTQVQQSLILAVAERDIARRELAETLSISDNANLAAADAIAQAGIWELSLPESIVLAFRNRAELKQLLLQREISEEQRTVALSEIRPTITTAANYTLKDDFDDNFDITDEYSLGLNIQWRLFDGGAASAGAQQAEKEIEIAETQFANTRNEIRLAVERAYLQLISNQDNLNTAAEGVELAEESLEMARLRFQEGIGTQTDVIDAQTVLTSARGNLLVAIIQYNQSYANLQRQVSNTSDNSLQELP